MEYKTDFTATEIDNTIDRASKVYANNRYMIRKVNVLKDLRDKLRNTGDKELTVRQHNFLCSLMNTFSDEVLTKAENWAKDWNTDKELRERADVISKYYIAQGSWFMEIANTVQRSLTSPASNIVPDFYLFHKMTLNEYAEKVWKSHKSPHRWETGQLVCCRSNAKIDGWTYQIRREGIDVTKDPCIVLESDSRPISNASKYDEKRGGCRWVSINPIGTSYIFNVMEKDLKIYRQPKKKPTKRSKK